MCLQFGGALGNLVDRVTIGHVTDFISVGSFPVFNVADSSISVGVVILIVGMWIKERNTRPPLPLTKEEPASQERIPEEVQGE
jgi:signal peptidase II